MTLLFIGSARGSTADAGVAADERTVRPDAADDQPGANAMNRDPILLTPGPLTTTLRTKHAMLRDWGSWDSRSTR